MSYNKVKEQVYNKTNAQAKRPNLL